MEAKKILAAAAISGATAVAIGAFGAHGLKPHLSDYQRDIFEKGVQYHFVHTLAMLAAGLLFAQFRNAHFRQAGWLFLAGVACFSGSLYLLACRDLLPFSVGFAGPVTPIGGVLFIFAWLKIWWGVRQLA